MEVKKVMSFRVLHFNWNSRVHRKMSVKEFIEGEITIPCSIVPIDHKLVKVRLSTMRLVTARNRV